MLSPRLITNCRSYFVQNIRINTILGKKKLRPSSCAHESRFEVSTLNQGSTQDDVFLDPYVTYTCRSTTSWLAPQYSNCPASRHATGAVWMSDVQCKGNESSLEQCSRAAWGRAKPICGDHTSDVCLVCDNPKYQNSGESSFTHHPLERSGELSVRNVIAGQTLRRLL